MKYGCFLVKKIKKKIYNFNEPGSKFKYQKNEMLDISSYQKQPKSIKIQPYIHIPKYGKLICIMF